MKAWILLFLVLGCARFQLRAQPSQHPAHAPGLSEPISFDGLTIWIIDGADRFVHPYGTLEEALSGGTATVYNENSQTLTIVNRSDTDLFIEAGDLIKGGQQDRMIADDRILPAHDSSSDLTVFCIEQGRSTARGTEPLATFSSSHWMAPFAHTRMVARASLTERLLTPEIGGLTAPDSSKLALLDALPSLSTPFGYPDPTQESVWNDVTQVQHGLTRALRDSVTKNASPTSLELALEHSSVTDRERAFGSRFGKSADDDAKSIGFVYALHGRLTGAEQYATHTLFVAMWPKLLRSIAVAAIAAAPASEAPLPSLDEVENFLNEHGTASAQESIDSRTAIDATRTQNTTRFVTADRIFASSPLHVEWIAR